MSRTPPSSQGPFARVPGELLAGRPVIVPVDGASMRPLLRSGDYVLVDPTLEPRIGAIVLALVEGTFVMHRVVARSGAAWTLCGDSSDRNDPPVTRASILGVSRERFRASACAATNLLEPTATAMLRHRLTRFGWRCGRAVTRRLASIRNLS